MLTLSDMGQLHPIRTPSGQSVTLTPEEEREVVKKAIAAKIQQRMLFKTDSLKALIAAIGTAIGLALGGTTVAAILKARK